MISSITPLGERGRGQRWVVTVAFFVVGSTLAGAALGGALGALGSLAQDAPVVDDELRTGMLAALVLAGLAVEVGGWRVPGPRRQVNENWLPAFRGWVYGGAFGVQLGLGVATIVSTSLVWVAFAAAFLTGSTQAGLSIGAAFGLVRGVGILPGGAATTPERLRSLGAALEQGRSVSAGVALGAQVAIAASLCAVTI